MSTRRAEEEKKYVNAYAHENYRMGDARKLYAKELLKGVTLESKSHLDVGCGRGEMVSYGKFLGMRSIGIETCPTLLDGLHVIKGYAHDVPFGDKSFDVVTMFDVIEHLLPEDEPLVLTELKRVARKHIFLTAANYPSKSLGTELHINVKPYESWDAIFREVYHDGWKVHWLPRKYGINSETWWIECQ
jgi:2-polyprenyl-3-methyl-5-hydroxy-6-metoxy-1,4-benzoquinol methylase